MDMEFDKDKWNEKGDIYYKFRRQMINDLVKNHLNSKMSKREIIDILGQSNFRDTTTNSELTFEIYEDYGWDIDPVETQNLIITLDSDSTLDKVYLETWRHLKGTEKREFPVR